MISENTDDRPQKAQVGSIRTGAPADAEGLPGEGESPFDTAIQMIRARIKQENSLIPRCEEDIVAAEAKLETAKSGLAYIRRTVTNFEDSEAQLIVARMEHLGHRLTPTPEGDWKDEAIGIATSQGYGAEYGKPIDSHHFTVRRQDGIGPLPDDHPCKLCGRPKIEHTMGKAVPTVESDPAHSIPPPTWRSNQDIGNGPW